MIPRSTAPLFSCSTLSRSAPPGGGGTFWGAMGLLFQTLAAIVEKVFEPLNREQTNEGRFREMPPRPTSIHGPDRPSRARTIAQPIPALRPITRFRGTNNANGLTCGIPFSSMRRLRKILQDGPRPDASTRQ